MSGANTRNRWCVQPYELHNERVRVQAHKYNSTGNVVVAVLPLRPSTVGYMICYS